MLLMASSNSKMVRFHASQWCIIVPEQLRCDVLQEAHAGCFAAHFAEKKVYDRLCRSVWWRGLKADVRRHCRGCQVCASHSENVQTSALADPSVACFTV